jgi:hypothetical protein
MMQDYSVVVGYDDTETLILSIEYVTAKDEQSACDAAKKQLREVWAIDNDEGQGEESLRLESITVYQVIKGYRRLYSLS